MSSTGSDTVTIGSRCGALQPAQPAPPVPSFCAGGWFSPEREMMQSEVARPWLKQWSPEEHRWRHMTGQHRLEAFQAAGQQQQVPAWAPAPPVAARPARAAPPPPAAAAATQPTVTLELAAGGRIDVRQLPQGAAVSLEATAEGSLLLELALPPGGKLRLGLGAAAAASTAGAASAAVFQPPPAVPATPVLNFSPPAAAAPQPAAATAHSQALGAESTVSSPMHNTAPDVAAWAALAAAAGAGADTTTTQRAAGPAPASVAVSDAGTASPLAALSLALQDMNWNKPELPPSWHLTVRQGDSPLRSIRLDASATSVLRINKPRRAVVLKGTGAHERLVVRLRRGQWRQAMQLLSRAVAETASGVRLWSQRGSSLLSTSLLPGAAAALAAAQQRVTAGVAATGAEPAGEPTQQGAMSPAGLLHDLRAAAPAECLTAEPLGAAQRGGDGTAAPRPGQPGDAQASLARLSDLQREAGEVAAGASPDC